MTKSDLETITKTVSEQYRAELAAMAKTKDRHYGFTKKQIDEDGLRNIITALRCKGILTVDP